MALHAPRYKAPKFVIPKDFREYVTITRETQGAVNDFGEPTVTWSEIATNVACVIVQQSGSPLLMALLGQVSITNNLGVFATDIDIKIRDRVTDSSGNEYDVIKLAKHATHIETELSIREKQ